METYLLDHSYPSSDNKSLTAILYGELGMSDFAVKHKILSGYADKGLLNYVVRWNVKVMHLLLSYININIKRLNYYRKMIPFHLNFVRYILNKAIFTVGKRQTKIKTVRLWS